MRSPVLIGMVVAVLAAGPARAQRLPWMGSEPGPAKAASFARQYFSSWSGDNAAALAFGVAHYQPELLFYGRMTPRSSVLAQKDAFVRRWPLRSYVIVPDSLAVRCTADERVCEVSGVVDWTCRSPERGAVSSGTATFGLRLVLEGGVTLIAMETGAVTSRRTPPQPAPAPQPPAAPPLPGVDVPPPRPGPRLP